MNATTEFKVLSDVERYVCYVHARSGGRRYTRAMEMTAVERILGVEHAWQLQIIREPVSNQQFNETSQTREFGCRALAMFALIKSHTVGIFAHEGDAAMYVTGWTQSRLGRAREEAVRLELIDPNHPVATPKLLELWKTLGLFPLYGADRN